MADVSSSLKDWSTTASSNSPTDSTTIGAGLADNFQQIQATVRQALAHKGSDITSAATIDIGAVEGSYHDVTGSTGPITSFGTVSAGITKILQFDSTPTLTHDGTSLILPGGANIVAAAGDHLFAVSLGSGNWVVPWYTRAASAPLSFASAAETLTGTSAVKALTPAGFAGNLDITGAAGYYKLPGGLIFQWDSITTDGSGDVTWTYPTAFSTAAFIVVGNAKGGDAGLMISTDAPGTTTCALYVRQHDNAQPSTVSMSVFAVGV